MQKTVLQTIAILFIYFLTFSSIFACTDFRITAKDGTEIIARSLEFGIDLESNLRTSTRNRTYTSTTPNGKQGLTWKAKYGYVFLDALNQDITCDGMNENGLSFEYLYLPGETQYQTVPGGSDDKALPYYQFGDWILSNFKSVDEVKQALKNVYVFEQTLPQLGSMIFPVHAAIHDAAGNGIVVEFVAGKMRLHEFVGVMTNSPTYKWQTTNLRNYLNLTPYNPKPVLVNGMTFSVTGEGAGMVGLPGDSSPPSRFVKVSYLTKTVYPANNESDAINIAEHIMNNVDIPSGMARTVENGKESTDSTEWVVFKDLTHRVIYYRTYNDMTLRRVSFDKLNFAENAKRLRMPLASAPYVVDMNNKFLNSKD